MIKKIKSALILILFIMAFSVVFAQTNEFESLDITSLNQNPDPVYAGDIVEVAISLKNIGYGLLDDKDIYLQIKDEFPFTVISEHKIDLNQIFSSNDYVATQKIKLKIDPNTKAGDYELTIKEVNGNTIIEHSINISVASNTNIEVISIDKNSIKPGEIQNITFKIKNVGSTNLRNIEFSWENSDLVLLSVNGDNKMFIDSLKTNEEKNVIFTIRASSAASADLYQIDIIITYENTKTSTTTKETSNAGLYIGGETDFDLTFDEKSNSEYIFTIANIGANDANAVKVSIDNNSNWKTSSKSSEMIGTLSMGDYTTFSFEFTRDAKDNLILRIDYTDTSGNRKSEIRSINIKSDTNSNSTFIQRNLENMNAGASNTQRGGPMSGIASGISTLKTWGSYTLYILFGALGIFILLKLYKKKIVKKVKN